MKLIFIDLNKSIELSGFIILKLRQRQKIGKAGKNLKSIIYLLKIHIN